MEDIEKKLKSLASAILILGIIASVIGSFILFSNTAYYNLGPFFAVLILGILFSVVSSFKLYGLGELIESTKNLEKNFCKEEKSEESATNTDVPNEEVNHNTKYCKNCGAELEADVKFCIKCGTQVE